VSQNIYSDLGLVPDDSRMRRLSERLDGAAEWPMVLLVARSAIDGGPTKP